MKIRVKLNNMQVRFFDSILASVKVSDRASINKTSSLFKVLDPINKNYDAEAERMRKETEAKQNAQANAEGEQVDLTAESSKQAEELNMQIVNIDMERELYAHAKHMIEMCPEAIGGLKGKAQIELYTAVAEAFDKVPEEI